MRDCVGVIGVQRWIPASQILGDPDHCNSCGVDSYENRIKVEVGTFLDVKKWH